MAVVCIRVHACFSFIISYTTGSAQGIFEASCPNLRARLINSINYVKLFWDPYFVGFVRLIHKVVVIRLQGLYDSMMAITCKDTQSGFYSVKSYNGSNQKKVVIK